MTRGSRSFQRSTIGLLALAVTIGVAGCAPAERPGAASDDGDAYPVTVTNCGADVTFDEAPERLVLLKSASVPALHELGLLDRVVARAGAYPEAYYDESTLEELDGIPLLTDAVDPAGHLQISQDVILDEEPDVVFGQTDTLDAGAWDRVGVRMLEEPALCSAGEAEQPSFSSINDQLRVYGTVFDRVAEAENAIAELEERVETAIAAADPHESRTAAVLYPTVGGGATYAYGTASMAHPQLQVAGFTNVFADVDERVFEVTPEELVGRNPDVLILLHTNGDPEAVEAAITDLPGADALRAVEGGSVFVQLMNFTEPATPLAVTGLERIIERFVE